MSDEELIANLRRMPQEILDIIWCHLMRMPGVHFVDYHFTEENVDHFLRLRQLELAQARGQQMSASTTDLSGAWGPYPQAAFHWDCGFDTEAILSTPQVNAHFQRASKYARDTAHFGISHAMTRELNFLWSLLPIDDEREVEYVSWQPDDHRASIRMLFARKEDLLCLLRPLQGVGLANLSYVTRWATPVPAIPNSVCSPLDLNQKYPALVKAKSIAFVWDPAIHVRNCHGCKLLGLHYQGMQDEARAHRQREHRRREKSIPKPHCRMCKKVETGLAGYVGSDRVQEQQRIRSALLLDRTIAVRARVERENTERRHRSEPEHTGEDEPAGDLDVTALDILLYGHSMQDVSADEPRVRENCNWDPVRDFIGDIGTHTVDLKPLPNVDAADYPWRPLHSSDLDDDDDSVSICSSDLDHDDFARYNHSERKHVIDTLPIAYSEDYGHVVHNTGGPRPFIRPLPSTPPRLDLLASSFDLPPTEDAKHPTLRQWHDHNTPAPLHGTHPECSPYNDLPCLYDTDLAAPLFCCSFKRCENFFLIDFGIALRPEATHIPIPGHAWFDETGGIYVEVDPTDDRWTIPGRDAAAVRGNSAECVAYIQHCWAARRAVGRETGTAPAMALMAYVRVADRGRFTGVLPGGGIGDGTNLPRYQRLRYAVQSLVGPEASEAVRNRYSLDLTNQGDLDTRWFAKDHYAFRGFSDEMVARKEEVDKGQGALNQETIGVSGDSGSGEVARAQVRDVEDVKM